jgi:hypothetical protein
MTWETLTLSNSLISGDLLFVEGRGFEMQTTFLRIHGHFSIKRCRLRASKSGHFRDTTARAGPRFRQPSTEGLLEPLPLKRPFDDHRIFRLSRVPPPIPFSPGQCLPLPSRADRELDLVQPLMGLRFPFQIVGPRHRPLALRANCVDLPNSIYASSAVWCAHRFECTVD